MATLVENWHPLLAASAPPDKTKGPALQRSTGPFINPAPSGAKTYFVMFATTPAPTVRPPSRIAKRRP